MRLAFFIVAWILVAMNLLALLSFWGVRKRHVDDKKGLFCWWGGVIVESLQILFIIWAMLCH